jgi:hypothetical protein
LPSRRRASPSFLAGALLVANAIEWFDSTLELGQGVPVVAIIGGGKDVDDDAIGAILGSPPLLATIAIALVGVAALG